MPSSKSLPSDLLVAKDRHTLHTDSPCAYQKRKLYAWIAESNLVTADKCLGRPKCSH